MKLRKSMAAMATAVACTLTPVAVPVIAPTAVAATTEKNYSREYSSISTKLDQSRKSYKGTLDDANAYKATSDEGKRKVSEALYQLDLAKPGIDRAETNFKDILANSDDDEKKASKNYNEDNAASLDAASAALNEVDTNLTKARRALDEAYDADKKAADEKEKNNVDCSKYEVKSDDDSSSGSSDFDFFGSSGYEKVYENGKAKCVKKSEIWTDRLAKIVTVLGTMFTLVTTLTKIDGALKAMTPGAPAA